MESGAQAADDYGEAVLAGEVDREAFVTHDFGVRNIGESSLGELDAFAERKHRRFAARMRGYRDDDTTVKGRSPAHEIFVAQRNRVECARVHCGHCHQLSSCQAIGWASM